MNRLLTTTTLVGLSLLLLVPNNMFADDSGVVVSWGTQTIPLSFYQARRITAVAAGSTHTIFLRSDGTVATLGDHYYGQTTVPTSLTGIVQVAAGVRHSLALKSDGTVSGWG